MYCSLQPLCNHTIVSRTNYQRFSPKTPNYIKSQFHSNTGMLIDSCRIISKSRDKILGHSNRSKNLYNSSKKTNGDFYSQRQSKDILKALKRSPAHFIKEESNYSKSKNIEVLKNNNEMNNYNDGNERLTAMEISEGVVYKHGGIGFAKFRQSVNTNNQIDEIKKEVLERKYRLKAYQHDIIRSLETQRADSLEDENEASAQIVYTQPSEETWIQKNILINNSRFRTKTKPDISTDINGRFNIKNNHLIKGFPQKNIINNSHYHEKTKCKTTIIKPYISKKVNTKSKMELLQKREHKKNTC